MSLIYITGPTGAGKTTIRRRLEELGYKTYDTDEDGIAEHQDSKTGEPIEYPTDPKERTSEWQSRHSFNLSQAKIEHLVTEAKDRLVFLCGAASNDLEFASYFEKIICLSIDEAEAERRVLSRTTNNYGKSPEELKEILARHKSVIDKYRDFGADIVEAGQSQEAVIARIIELSRDMD